MRGYLVAERAYYDRWLESVRGLRDELAGELAARVIPADDSVSWRRGGRSYFTRTGVHDSFVGDDLVWLVTSGSESRCLSDGQPELGCAGWAGGPEFVPPAAGVLAAQGDYVGGALDGPVHPGLLGALAHDLLAGCLDCS